MRKELLLTVEAELDECTIIKSDETEVRFIRFHGCASSEYFNGRILPGGVDTQLCSGDPLTAALSARYVLEGVDFKGEKCLVFIENNGCETEAGIRTKPIIITDSKALQTLFAAELSGEVMGADGSVYINIYRN